MVRWTSRGTHSGTAKGIATADVVREAGPGFHRQLLSTIRPTGHRLSFDGVAVFRITSGKVASLWLLLDQVDVLRQLGASPLP